MIGQTIMSDTLVPLHGMRVRLERGSDVKNNYCASLAVIRVDADRAELRCAGCGRYRGRLSATMVRWLLAILEQYPAAREQPVILRDAYYANPLNDSNKQSDCSNPRRPGTRQDHAGEPL